MFGKNMSVSGKLLIILIMPMLGILWFGAMRVTEGIAHASAAKQIVKDTDFVGVLGSLIHELQKERGATSVFIGSRGAKMKDRLPGLRADSDKTVQAFKSRATSQFTNGNKEMQGALSGLDKLGVTRQQADALQISAADAGGQYTAIIQSLLELASSLGQGSTDTESMRDTNSYVSYMNVKELAGRDRALLAGIIGAGKADIAQLMKVSGNLGEYKRALAQFSLVATPEQLALHREKVTGKAVDEVERIHKVVLDTPVGQELGLDGAYWFDVSTERINMMKDVQDKLTNNLHDRAAEKRDAATATLVVTAIVTGILLLVAILMAWLSARSITGPLNQMRTTITEVEKNGDFTRRIPVNSEDEVGQTARSFNELMTALQQTLGQILDSVGKVSDAALSVSSSSGQVATSSSSQSEATSAMAAAVEEMTVSINHVSDSAHEAVGISRKSGKLSSEGGEVIHKATAEMSQIAETVRNTAQAIEELGQHSNKISSIVQVIKEVADQTNLLALNAAIEAARAGEQGRGFAVVADEVRKLAERTTKATEEITQMIASMQHSARAAVSTMDSAVDQVSGGVALANQAGSAIVQIKDGADQVVGVVNDISSALAEQSSASNDIAAQVEKVAQMTEENSAAAAETASAANNLQVLADTMQAAVSRFKI